MKILILAYDFPPHVSIGALRPYSWFNYFPEDGIETTVVTRHWPPGAGSWQEQISATEMQMAVTETEGLKKLIRVPFVPGLKEKLLLGLQGDRYRRMRQAITFIYSYLEHFGMRMDSSANLYAEARKEMSRGRYDYIIATGRPFILFKYAHALASEFEVPWIADYRDSWTMSHIQGNFSIGFATRVLNRFYSYKEKGYLANAKWITTAAPTYARSMPPYFPKENIKYIYNGYDHKVADSVKGLVPEMGKFIISYAGTIYPMQLLELWLESFSLFISKNRLTPNEVEVHFWGLEGDTESIRRIRSYDASLLNFMVFHKKVSYPDVMAELSKAHILLLLGSTSDDWLNAKLFDYLALKRRILMVGNKNNVMTRFIDECEAGVSEDGAGTIADYLGNIYKTFLSGENMAISPINYQQFSRKNQAHIFSQLLKNS